MVISANTGSPVAVMLFDPATGNPYKAYSAPAPGVAISPNPQSPKATVALNTSGVPYKP